MEPEICHNEIGWVIRPVGMRIQQPVGYDTHYADVSGNFLNAGGGPSTYFGRWRRVIDLYLPVVKR